MITLPAGTVGRERTKRNASPSSAVTSTWAGAVGAAGDLAGGVLLTGPTGSAAEPGVEPGPTEDGGVDQGVVELGPLEAGWEGFEVVPAPCLWRDFLLARG